MHKTELNIKRIAFCISATVFVTFFFIYNLIVAGGLFAGADSEHQEKKAQLQQEEARKITLEGPIIDRNGDAITQAETVGKPAVLLFDECYSYLVGYNCKMYGTSGLRSRMGKYLFDGGTDNIGAEITLTTDNGLQQFCYDILGASEGSVIVMNADTGALLACTSRSHAQVGYNANLVCDDPELNKYPEYRNYDSFFFNRSTTSADPPGSTFKIVTAASLLENDMGDYVYNDTTGFVEIDGAKLRNFADAVQGKVDLQKALNQSVNVYFATAAQHLRAYNLQITAEKFMLGVPLDLDFCDLYANFDLGDMSDNVLLARTAFGQGHTTVAPLQIVMFMEAVLCDGTINKPYLIERITDDGKVIQQTKPQVLSEAIEDHTARTLKEYLHSTAEGYGYTEDLYGMVYAKTGTADMANGMNHIYMLIGVEIEEKGNFVILIDRRNTTSTSGAVKKDAESILNYLLSM